jgi:phage terminase small subunit
MAYRTRKCASRRRKTSRRRKASRRVRRGGDFMDDAANEIWKRMPKGTV